MNYSLRPIEESDHEWLVVLHNDPLVLKNVTDPTIITLESHLKWWDGIKDSKSEERFIFCVDGMRAGFTKFYNIDRANKNCKLGADLHESFRGKGLAKHMWNLMIDRCFQVHRLHRIALTTAEYNDVGIYTYLSLGFRIEGRNKCSLLRDGKFFDEVCMYMLESFRNEKPTRREGLQKCASCSEFMIKKSHTHKVCKTCTPTNSSRSRYRRYKISSKQLQEMINDQHDCCFLCTKKFTNHQRGMHVVHDHELGTVRKLLCHRCNWIVGLIEKMTSDESLDKVLDYVKMFK